MELFELIKTLAAAHGPAGSEEGIRAVIRELAQPYADDITEDIMGNLIVRKGGSGPKIMFAAHMDSIGFIVTHIEKEGYLRVGPVGGIHPADVVSAPIRFANGTRGVFAMEQSAEYGKLKLDQCYIDIGAKDAEEAKSMVQVGDTAVYDTATFSNNGKVFSPYLDNRVACAVLLKALEDFGDTPNDCYFVFTTQEEVGLRGAKTAAWAIDPDYGIAVDVTATDDIPGAGKHGTTQFGKGAAIKLMDRSIICHPAVVAKLTALAEEQGIANQKDILDFGGTDAGIIHTTRMGVYSGGISIPSRYVHSPQEMADLADVQSCVELVRAFAKAELKQD